MLSCTNEISWDFTVLARLASLPGFSFLLIFWGLITVNPPWHCARLWTPKSSSFISRLSISTTSLGDELWSESHSCQLLVLFPKATDVEASKSTLFGCLCFLSYFFEVCFHHFISICNFLPLTNETASKARRTCSGSLWICAVLRSRQYAQHISADMMVGMRWTPWNLWNLDSKHLSKSPCWGRAHCICEDRGRMARMFHQLISVVCHFSRRWLKLHKIPRAINSGAAGQDVHFLSGPHQWLGRCRHALAGWSTFWEQRPVTVFSVPIPFQQIRAARTPQRASNRFSLCTKTWKFAATTSPGEVNNKRVEMVDLASRIFDAQKSERFGAQEKCLLELVIWGFIW